ncbi:hypothetical protein [Stenotrophomonas sp. LARHCG68]
MKERFLGLSLHSNGSSRVGGRAPEAVLGMAEFRPGSRFLLLLAGADFPELNGKDLSIMLDEGFLPTDEDTIYPRIGIRCFLHAPSPESLDASTILDSIANGSLVPATEGDSWFVKIGGEPVLIQREDYYFSAVTGAGYEFYFQVDENGFPDGFVLEDYPLNYGGLYIYAKFDAGGKVEEVVAGFTQF